MKLFFTTFILFVFSVSVCAQKKPAPIIDMHVHANHANFAGSVPMTICIYNDAFQHTPTGASWGDTLMAAAKKCKHPLTSPLTDDEVMNQTLSIFRKRNIIAVTNGRLLEKW